MADSALWEKQKQIDDAIAQKALGRFSVLTGRIKDQRVTLVLIGCVPSAYRNLLRTLKELLVEYPYLSLHLTGGVCNIQFILRGVLPNPNWVWDNLIKNKKLNEHDVRINTFDVTAERLRWFDEPGHGPIKIEKLGSDDARRRVAAGGRWLDEPFKGTPFYLFFASATANASAMVAQARAGERLLLRDLFEVEKETHQLADGVPVSSWGRVDDTLVAPKAIGVVDLEKRDYANLTHGVTFPIKAKTAYQCLTAWRADFLEPRTGTSVEIFPLEAVREGDDFVDDPHLLWSERLKGEGVKNRLSVGWMGTAGAPDLTASPKFEVERLTTVVLGEPRSGKSIVAYHLLACYLKLDAKKPFTVVYWNCKIGEQQDSVAKSTSGMNGRPQNPNGLIDFAAIVHNALRQPVIAARTGDLLAKFKKSSKRVRAYYTELDPDDKTAVEDCIRLGDEIGSNFVFCFDEIVNRKVSQGHPLLEYLEQIYKVGGEHNRYFMLVHQVMDELFTNGQEFTKQKDDHLRLMSTWPGVPDASCFFLKKLPPRDQGLYDRYCKKKVAYFGEDIPAFKKMKNTQVAVLQPYQGSKEKPIPLSLPVYSLPDKNLMERLKDNAEWGEIDYGKLTKNA